VNRSIINSTNFNNFLSDGSTISMIVESVPETEDQPDCVLSLNNSNAAITHCDPSQTLNFEKTEFGESYFDFTGASNRCQQKGGLITRSQLEEKLLNGICIDASGFRPYPGRSLTNLDKLYVWSDNGNSSGQNLMTVIKPIRDDDGNYTYDIVDESLTALGGSANSMMKCICADQ